MDTPVFSAGIREMFEKTGFYKTVDRHHVYISLHDAVQHSIYTEDTSIEVGQYQRHTTSAAWKCKVLPYLPWVLEYLNSLF